jgi:hypothetical protein
MFLVSSIALFAVVLILVFWVRPSDIELGPPPNPKEHLEERKAAVYSNLRDLTFEYRLGKLSEADYEKTKHGLQEELAKVLAELDSPVGTVKSGSASASAKLPATPAKAASIQTDQPKPVAPKPDPLVCPYCNAQFEKPMRFCGECGKPMLEVKV